MYLALNEKRGIKNKFTFQKHIYNKDFVRTAFPKMCSMEHMSHIMIQEKNKLGNVLH